jgi:hypothetical protein
LGVSAEAGLHRHPAYGSTQAPERDDILNIGGFSDAVFNVVASYLGDDAGRFVAEVESIELYYDFGGWTLVSATTMMV